MKIGIDIDDTITETKKLQEKLWQEFYKNNKNPKYTSTLPININTSYEPYISKFWDTYREELGFDPIIKENANKYIKLLQNKGYKLCIITSRPQHKYKEPLVPKIKKYMEANNIYIDEIITDAYKKGEHLDKYHIDILVDDSISQINSAIEHNKIGIHFNDDSPFPYHVSSWKDLYQLIIDNF